MAVWKVTPTWKKSIVERNYWTKGNDEVTHEIGWRWGEFFFESDDEPSDLKDGDFNVFDCGYDLIDFSTDDGCWEETDISIEDEDEYDNVSEFLAENSVYDLEESGWSCNDSEMWIQCECEVEEVSR